MRIEKLLERRVDKTPQKPFLTFPSDSYSFHEAQTKAKQYANALAAMGIKSDDRIGLFLPNSSDFVFTMFAAAYLDAVIAPSNPEYQDRELRHSLELSEPSLLVTTEELLETAEKAVIDTDVKKILTLDQVDGYDSLSIKAANSSPEFESLGSDPSAPAIHVYTSGTTGPPKAVEATHENWTISALDFQKRMGFTYQDTLLTALPLFHANAQIYSMLGAVAAGAEVVIYKKFSSSQWWEWCREHEATEFNAMGSMLKMLESLPPRDEDDNNPVELVFSAGTPPDLIEPFEERFDLRVVEGYSLSEDPLLMLNPTDPEKRRIGSVGLPPAEKSVRIVDENGEEVSTGERGEITMRCPALMEGYYEQPEKTEEAIVDGWFYTGDYGRVDEDGFIYFIDRKKDIVRRGGENISSHEVEGVIKSIENIDEVAIIPSPDEFYGEVVKAIVRTKSGHKIDPQEIIDSVDDELANFKVPMYVEFVDEFPYTPTGKIQKQKLREREKSQEIDHWSRE